MINSKNRERWEVMIILTGNKEKDVFKPLGYMAVVF